MSTTEKSRRVEFEFSAGGVVADGDRVLLIKTKDLKGRDVWTFPKGKLKKKESSGEAALREVQEETGYSCEIKAPLDDVRYMYQRDNALVIKKVRWFLMSPIKRESGPESEVEAAEWKDYGSAENLLTYRSDLALLGKIREK